MKTLTKQYEELTNAMSKEFYKKYFWNSDEEYSDLDADYYSECYMIWSSSKRSWNPSWPLDIREWTYIFSIDNIRTALERNIPKHILIDWYDKHQDWYNFEEFWKVNLWHYYRQNHDPEVYDEEQRIDKEESLERVMNTAWLLDEMLWQEKWTFYNQYIKSSLSSINNNEHSSS